MSKILSVAVYVVLLASLIIVVACNTDAEVLNDKTNQVELKLKIDADYEHGKAGYLYPDENFNIIVEAIDTNNLPQKTTYVWTFIQTTGGNYFEESEEQYDKAVGYLEYTDHDFDDEGSYTIRCDLYDTEEFKISGIIAPRLGTIEQHISVQAVDIEVNTELMGEGTYRFTPHILNPEIEPVIWAYRYDFGDGIKELSNTPDGSITHEYKKEGTFSVIVETLVFSSEYMMDQTIATYKLSVSVLGSEFYIEVPSTPLMVGKEYTFRAMTSGLLPPNVSYEWEFGDNNGIKIPVTSEATHLYEKEGDYTIRVLLFESDEEAAPLLGVATVDIVVAVETLSIIEAYQNVKHIDIYISTWILWRYEEGKKPSPSASDQTFGDAVASYKASTKSNEITWQGTEFKIKSSDGQFTCNGQISDDGSELLYLEVAYVWDSGTKGSSTYTLQNVPLKKSAGIGGSPDAVELTNNFGYYSFEFSATGSEIESFVSSQSHHEEYDLIGIVAKNFDGWDPERVDRHSFELVFYVTQGD